MIRDVSHLFGDDRIVLLHRPARHEPPHIREFRDGVAASLREAPTC